jgi:hypothetical protein
MIIHLGGYLLYRIGEEHYRKCTNIIERNYEIIIGSILELGVKLTEASQKFTIKSTHKKGRMKFNKPS